MNEPTPQEVAERLAEPFGPEDIRFLPKVVSGNRALAMAYVNARAIQDRLDDALGIHNWQDSYTVLANGCVVCRLLVRIGGEWIAKEDVGSPSEQPDKHDQTKAAYSDALKRCAVKYGVGRYLYSLPSQWVDYDPQKKQFVKVPTLPAWALPDTITQEQGHALSSLARKHGVNPQSVLDNFHIERLGRLRARDYKAVEEWISGHKPAASPAA